ncbi:MAG: AAA family ATPase [Raoultibacter sp.]
MTSDVVLCADTESLKEPSLIGLEGENLCAQPWIRVFADACQARRYLRQSHRPHEVWVASSDTVDPINLAAALKHDSTENKVYLLAFQGSGSLKSRANAAGIDGMFDRASFAQRYGSRKQASLAPSRSIRCVKEPSSSHRPERPKQKSMTEQVQAIKGLDSEFLRGLDLGQRHTDDKAKTAEAPLDAFAPSPAPAPTSEPAPAPQPQPVPAAVPDPAGGRFDAGQGLQHEGKTAAATAPANPPSCARVAAGRQAIVLAVASASGGAGKSTVAALAATCAQKRGHKTLLIDADLQFGDEQFLLGIEHPLTIDEALRDTARFKNLKPEGGLPALVAAPQHLEQSESVLEELPRLLEAAKESFDVVVVNTGAFWTDQHALLLEQATRVLFLVDQRPSSLRACNHALDLCARCGIATQSFLFAVNRCARNALFSSIDVSCGLRGAHVAELKEGGHEVDELLGAGMPLALVQAQNALCLSLEALLADILPAGEGLELTSFSEGEKPYGRHGRLSKWKRKVACLC